MDIESERLFMKEITKNDLPLIHQLHSCPEVDEFNTLGIPINQQETNKIMEPYFLDQKNKSRKYYCWAILKKTDNEFIGLCGMHLSADRFKLGEIYYKFFPQHWGKGYGTEITKILIKTGFENFKLHKIEAGVATDNIRSIKVLEKANMAREGLRRKILPIRGEWKDNYHYAIVEDDKRDY